MVHPLTTVTERATAAGRPLGGRHAGHRVAGREGARAGCAAQAGGPQGVAATPPAERPARTFTAEHVVFSAGTYGTQSLLHRLRVEGALPELSPRLGALTRTNSESLVGVVTRPAARDGPDFTHGVAITSSFFPDPNTHIEPVRYGKGSNAMCLLGTVLTDGAEGVPRYRQWAKAAPRNPQGRAGRRCGSAARPSAASSPWSCRT